MILSPRQVEIIHNAVQWAAKMPEGVQGLNLALADDASIDDIPLGHIITDAYGFVMWAVKDDA